MQEHEQSKTGTGESDRSVLLAHDSSEESRVAIAALQDRQGQEEITLLDVTKFRWSAH